MLNGRVLWIGGGCGSGKSSLARTVSHRFDLQLYAADAYGYSHLERLTGDSQPSLSHDERWLKPTPEELAERFLHESTGKFPLVVEDLNAIVDDGTLIVAEGPTMLPDLVAPHLEDPQHALFLIPTEDFQRRTLSRRGAGAGLGTSDPERAHANLLARNRLLDLTIEERASVLGLPTMEVNGSLTLEESARIVADLFAPMMNEGLRATDGNERRRMRRRENRAVYTNVSAYLQDLEKDVADAPPIPISCECTNPGCEAGIEFSPGSFSTVLSHPRRYVVAEGHETSSDEITARTDDALVVEAATDG